MYVTKPPMEAAGSYVEADNDQQVEAHKDSDGCLAPVAPGAGGLPGQGLAAFHAEWVDNNVCAAAGSLITAEWTAHLHMLKM